MGNIESAEGENIPELKKMKLIQDKGLYKVYENNENNKYDFWSLKSSEYSFQEELNIAEEIQKRDLIGIAKIKNIQQTIIEKLFTKYYCLSILIEHPAYTLREYLLKRAKNQCLDSKQIQNLLVSVVNAQYCLGSKKQYLGFDNIYTSDGTSWKIKPFFQSKSFYQELQEHKSKNLYIFEMSGFPSPEEFHQNNCDIDRVQIFGLGILILELITRAKCKDIYSKFQIDENILSQRIDLLRNRKKDFSGKFIELTIDMLDLDIVRRPNYYQLYTKLNSPESNIDSEVKNTQIQPIDQKSMKFNLFEPPQSQKIDINIINAISNIEQPGISKIDDHSIKISKAFQPQPQLNQIVDNHQYIGPSVNGKYHGEGKLFTQYHQLIYEGGFYEGQYHNIGKLNFLNSQILQGSFNYQDCTNVDQYASIYEGQFQHGKKHGNGRLTLTNGDVFTGTFVNNYIDGKGTFELNNQQKFSGFWEKGKLTQNRQSFQNKDSVNIEPFEGLSKLETKRSQQLESQGIGETETQTILSEVKEENVKKLYYDDKKTQIKYIGDIHQGLMHGKGKKYFINEKVEYEGDFQNDLFDGQGTLYNENPVIEHQINYSLLREVQIKGYWKRFEGAFQNGLKCGKGNWYLTNNSEFIGFFDNDLPNGEGVLRRINHEDFTAIWEFGELTSVISGKL